MTNREKPPQYVNQIPLEKLWRDGIFVEKEHLDHIGAERIVELLRQGIVSFVIADISAPLQWVPESECYDFWKTELKVHLADPKSNVHRREDFPGEYFYRVSEWTTAEDKPPVLLCERYH